MVLDPCLVVLVEETHGAHGAGCKELHGEDGVDLADKLVSDVDGGLGDGPAELVNGQLPNIAAIKYAGLETGCLP